MTLLGTLRKIEPEMVLIGNKRRITEDVCISFLWEKK
jgi:hypothetical protein